MAAAAASESTSASPKELDAALYIGGAACGGGLDLLAARAGVVFIFLFGRLQPAVPWTRRPRYRFRVPSS